MSGILDHSLTIRRNFVNRLRTIAGMTLVVILAACGPAASGGSTEPDASEGQASQAQSSGGGPEPSFSAGVVADLEALIPDTIGDITMDKSSMQGNEFLVSGDGDEATIAFLQDIGVSPNDVSMAIGFGFSADFAQGLSMFVFRAQGADPARLSSAWKTVLDADRETPLEWTDTNFGGKDVATSVDGINTNYVYSQGDVLVVVSSSDTALAEEAIRGLP